MLNPAIKVTSSDIEGAGLVADIFIPIGEVLYRFDDAKPPAHQYELIYRSREERLEFLKYACQIGDDDFCFQQGDIKYINHSCDPTGWWENYGILTARRNIEPGEEITYDYSTSDIQLHYQMQCCCGSHLCRGIVTDKDYLRPDFQKQYAGHLPKHVVEAIRLAEANEPGPQQCDVSQAPPDVILAVQQTVLAAAEFRERFGGEYVFQMIRQTILKLQSGGAGIEVTPEKSRKYDDEYIFTLVRQLVLMSLGEMIRKKRGPLGG
jgi:hypothetical protein